MIARRNNSSHWLNQKISILPSTGSIEDISDKLDWIMTSTISEVYSPDARDDHRLSQDPQVQISVKAMWNTYASYREAKTATFQNIFAKWKQFALFHKTSRAYKMKTKEVKKERLLQTAQELAQADKKGDQRKLWECAKRLAPWTAHLTRSSSSRKGMARRAKAKRRVSFRLGKQHLVALNLPPMHISGKLPRGDIDLLQ